MPSPDEEHPEIVPSEPLGGDGEPEGLAIEEVERRHQPANDDHPTENSHDQELLSSTGVALVECCYSSSPHGIVRSLAFQQTDQLFPYFCQIVRPILFLRHLLST